MNKSKTLLKKQNRDEAALQKYAMISPLLDENLDPAAAHELRCRLAEQHGVSERTLRRYMNAYKAGGFDGLRPGRYRAAPLNRSS